MHSGMALVSAAVLAAAVLIGCASSSVTEDAAVDGGTDLGAPADAALDTGVDSGADAGTSEWDSGLCGVGVECTNYAAALALAPQTAESVADCTAIPHQTDCCGAMAMPGVNRSEATRLCAAEVTCRGQYQAPYLGCSTDADCAPDQTCVSYHTQRTCMPNVELPCRDDTIVADTGETTNQIWQVSVRCVRPFACSAPSGTCCTCETYVCHDPSYCPAGVLDVCGFGGGGP